MCDPYAIHVHEAALRHQMPQSERRTTRKVPNAFVRAGGGAAESFAFSREGEGGAHVLCFELFDEQHGNKLSSVEGTKESHDTRVGTTEPRTALRLVYPVQPSEM